MTFRRAQPRSPAVITIVSWLGLLSGFFAFVSGAATMTLVPSVRGVELMAGGIMAAAAAIGLRMRREWARRSFIGVQALAIVDTVARAFVVWRRLAAQVGVEGMADPDIRAAVMHSRMSGLVMAFVFVAINGLIIERLCSAPVRAEFDRAEAAR